MKKEVRTAVYDDQLHIEAFHFNGILQPFPNHFHDYYVIGLLENGTRRLSCKNQEYIITKGQLILFHPGDSHSCAQCGDTALDYRGLNISKETMMNLTEEITGFRQLPGFCTNVISCQEAACYFSSLHQWIMDGSMEFCKEEQLLLLLSLLIQQYGQPFKNNIPECREEIGLACAFMEKHFAERISLDQLCELTKLGKTTLLRAFTKAKGITPYGYLETVRISQAKKLLEQGVLPIDAALLTGFSDQSHFTNYFNRYIGLTPGLYRSIFFTKTPEKEKTGGNSNGYQKQKMCHGN